MNQDFDRNNPLPGGPGGDASSPSGGSWSKQINRGFLYSPYMGVTDAEPYSVSTIQSAVEEAESLLATLQNGPAERNQEFATFVQTHAAAIEATAQSLVNREGNLPTVIHRVMQTTQTLI